MKKVIFLLFSLLCISFSAKAQMYVGGMVGFGVTAGNHAVFSYAIEPEVGYDFNDNCAAGVSLLLGGSASGDSAFDFKVAPYFRYSFYKIGPVGFFADAILGLGCTTVSIKMSENSKQTISSTGFSWNVGVAPGLIVDINKNWGFVAHLASIGVEGIEGSAVFNLSVLMGPSVGVKYSF